MIDHLTRRTQGAGIIKGGKDKRDRGFIPDSFIYNKNNTNAGPLTPQQLNPYSPTLYIWVQMLGGLGARACAIRVFRECIWNAPAVSIVLPAFDYIGSLSSSPRQVVYPPV